MIANIVYSIVGIIVSLAVAGVLTEEAQNNHPEKKLMRGCHGALVIVAWSNAPRPVGDVLCYNTTRLP